MVVDMGTIAVLVTLLLSIVATAFGYGMLTNKVSSNSSQIKDMKQQDKEIQDKLDALRLLVQRIESKLDK